jgi:predicted CoA-substrate-specific enzyme activase
MARYLGVDIGSISLNTVVLDEDREILCHRYDYCEGRPFRVLRDVLSEVTASYPVDYVALTGSGGEVARDLIGGRFVNEIVAQSASIIELHPEVRSIVEIGGEDSKLLYLDERQTHVRLKDFAMNSLCAAGTGSFLDQQARRIGVSIENEFGALALKSETPPRIAGRCSVFAKSDMIHLQQIATPLEDIVAGLCFAVARNFKSNLARGRNLPTPVSFQGGVAANQGMVRAIREVFELGDEDLIVPEFHAAMGAIGAVITLMEERSAANASGNGNRDDHRGERYIGTAELEQYLEQTHRDSDHLPPLRDTGSVGLREVHSPRGDEVVEVYLGIDVGSLSTNIVLIDSDNRVVARRYLPTAGKPLEAIRRGVAEIEAEVGDRIRVKGVGTTGSGRYLTGDFVGADTIQNEITAQATAAIAFHPEVDTVFEIGGQDSKFISIDNGVVVDFEMNKVCAAGTGSFLEEQAEKLGISIRDEFGAIALSSERPARLGDRCTVFMESDLNSHQQRGSRIDELVAGLAYSIVHNYLEKVVGNKRVGDHILFQGGVTNNRAVVAAFEQVTGKRITVPSHFDVTGAIGAAMLARDTVADGRESRFRGFDISRVAYKVDKFVCHGCSNECEIRRVKVEGRNRPLCYGGRCERYEVEERKNRNLDIPNLFVEREKMLLAGYSPEEEADGLADVDRAKGPGSRKPIVGIPRAMMVFWQQFPLWRTFFEMLGCRVVVSRESDRNLVSRSLGMLAAETCFPVSIVYGHVADLLDRRVDWVFMPFIAKSEARDDNPTENYNCPWVQTYPFIIRGALRETDAALKLLVPTLHLRHMPDVPADQLCATIGPALGVTAEAVRDAFRAGLRAQNDFERKVADRGREVLANLSADRVNTVILGRPYNTGDPELNLGLVEKLINLGVMPIPLDYLPLDTESLFNDYPMMYWPNGRRILQATRIVRDNDRLDAVFMGNFRCGPDSFLLHYVRHEMKGKPYLQLEVDEHSADAGMITRCEAFLDSLRSTRRPGTMERIPVATARDTQKDKGRAAVLSGVEGAHDTDSRTLFYPYMSDSSYALAAAARSCGVAAEILPIPDTRDLELGRRYTSSRECFPLICTVGSFLRKLSEPGVDPSQVSFFMPDHNGPCRFGQYRKLQRIIFDRLGFSEARIASPSNANAYVELSGGHPVRFRLRAWRGIVAADLLRRILGQVRPYERNKGDTDRVYQAAVEALVRRIENGARGLRRFMRKWVSRFGAIPRKEGPRKPIIAIVGEIYMRDTAFCNANVVERLEELGAETIMAPIHEWLSYSAYRFRRDSAWKHDRTGAVRAYVLDKAQKIIARPIFRGARAGLDPNLEIHLHEMLESCEPYIDRHYDGDPPLALGTAVALARRGISGVVNILPFTCQPGTLIIGVSPGLRSDFDDLPWVDIAYDGQDDASISTRLSAFMHQAHQRAARNLRGVTCQGGPRRRRTAETVLS